MASSSASTRFFSLTQKNQSLCRSSLDLSLSSLAFQEWSCSGQRYSSDGPLLVLLLLELVGEGADDEFLLGWGGADAGLLLAQNAAMGSRSR